MQSSASLPRNYLFLPQGDHHQQRGGPQSHWYGPKLPLTDQDGPQLSGLQGQGEPNRVGEEEKEER